MFPNDMKAPVKAAIEHCRPVGKFLMIINIIQTEITCLDKKLDNRKLLEVGKNRSNALFIRYLALKSIKKCMVLNIL